MIYRLNIYLYLLAVALETDSRVLRYSPGKSPNDSTLPSKSSSISDSGVTLKFIYVIQIIKHDIIHGRVKLLAND